jgi:hypothetical protein
LGSLEKPKQYFFVADFDIIDCGTSCSNAFYVLFSSFYALNTEYPNSVLRELYFFFEYDVFEIASKCSANVGAFISSLECLPLA